MTAIVGVLNKKGLAIAADSAVTLGNTHKVLNSGNKIFRLSKYAPVGVATYGNADFMGNPWEVVIKMYRRTLKDTKFPLLNDYVNNFLDYLRNNNFFSSDTNQKLFLSSQMQHFFEITKKSAESKPNFAVDQHAAIIDDINDCLSANKASINIIPDFAGLSLDDFKQYAQKEINEVLLQINEFVTQDEKDLFVESYFYYMRLNCLERSGETGLVFVGYGENEMYPSLKNVSITFGFDKKLRYRYGESTEITNDGTYASIIPFAQIDVAQTVIRGVNPSFYDILSESFNKSISSFKKQIADVIRKDPALAATADAVEQLDTQAITDRFTSGSKSAFKDKYTSPLVQTIGRLGIEDMANMAESLVSLTSLVRRMTPAEETVGGPVDVAVITKAEGFIWIKRKHYFQPELNTHFFDNYYND